MKFWDSSAIVPLLVEENCTPVIKALLLKDPDLIVWWATELECISPLARLERDGVLTLDGVSLAIRYLNELRES